jgi:hypothetical protein
MLFRKLKVSSDYSASSTGFGEVAKELRLTLEITGFADLLGRSRF